MDTSSVVRVLASTIAAVAVGFIAYWAMWLIVAILATIIWLCSVALFAGAAYVVTSEYIKGAAPMAKVTSLFGGLRAKFA